MLAQLPTGASSTTMTTVAEAPSSSATEPAAPLVLKLRGKRTRRLRWADDVVDNEDLDRKKSKCCCIFHPSEREADDGWRDRPEQHPCPEHDPGGLFAPLELPPLDGGDGGGAINPGQAGGGAASGGGGRAGAGMLNAQKPSNAGVLK